MHYDRGAYEDAVREFEAAYAMQPRPELLFNLYSAHERAGHAASAADYLTRYLDEGTIDPAVWGQNFPRQYDSYRRTVDTERTRHGGSEAFQKLDDDPRWRRIFAGYAFSVDYREERGHAYMLIDQDETERVKIAKQTGARIGWLDPQGNPGQPGRDSYAALMRYNLEQMKAALNE